MHPSHIMTQREIIRNNLNKSDWEITKDKCDPTRAHRRHLAANRKHEDKRKIYCTNVHLSIIEILITLMYNLSAVTAAVTPIYCAGLLGVGIVWFDLVFNPLIFIELIVEQESKYNRTQQGRWLISSLDPQKRVAALPRRQDVKMSSAFES